MRQFLYLCLLGTTLAGTSASAGTLDLGLASVTMGAGAANGSVSGEVGAQILGVGGTVGASVGKVTGASASAGASALGSGLSGSVSAGVANGAVSAGASAGAEALGVGAGGSLGATAGSGAVAASAEIGGGISESLSSGLAAGWSGVKDAASSVGNWASESLSSVGTGLKSAWSTGVEKAGSWLSSGTEAVKGVWKSAGESLGDMTDSITPFSSSTTGLASDSLGTFTNFDTGITTNFTAPFGETSTSFGALSDSTITTVDGVTGTVTGTDFNAPFGETTITTSFDTPIGEGAGELGISDTSPYSESFKAQDVYDKAGQQALAEDKAAEAEATSAAAQSPDKATVFNVIQYAIVILQALEGTEQEEITKNIIVKAQELQDSQGSSTPSTIASTTTSNVSLEATTLSAAANAMITLLQNNPIYPDLLSDEKCLLTGTSVASGSASGDSTDDIRMTTNYIQCMQKRRLVFANTTALSAQMIAEGSNAISHEFYDRVEALANAAKTTTGTLGSMSVVNDSERFPYFEMVRGSALSAVQLELKAASTLSELTGIMEEVKDAQ